MDGPYLCPVSRWIRACCLVCAIACGSRLVLADTDENGVPLRLLLMRNGNVVQGKIYRSGEDYFVQLPGGQMFVPGSLVRLPCADLNEAYEHLHERAAIQSEAEAYITLAKWCVTQKLFAEARRELETALELEPAKQSARDLLLRLDALARDAEKVHDVDPRETPRPKSSKKAESLAGLNRDLAQQFTRRIQPILANNCGASGCHGPRAENGFRLQKVAGGGVSNRLAAERNLAAVLEYIDVENPAQSALLVAPRGNHGRGGKPVFSGATGKEQMAELKSWVLEAASEESVLEARGIARTPGRTARQPARQGENPFAVHDAEVARRTGERSSAVRQAGGEQPADAFDPEEFNRARKRTSGRR